MNFNIEKGIPFEEPKVSKFSNFPLEQMLPGDSFVVPFDYTSRPSLASYLSIYNKKNSVKFTYKTTETGYRIFKIN